MKNEDLGERAKILQNRERRIVIKGAPWGRTIVVLAGLGLGLTVLFPLVWEWERYFDTSLKPLSLWVPMAGIGLLLYAIVGYLGVLTTATEQVSFLILDVLRSYDSFDGPVVEILNVHTRNRLRKFLGLDEER